MKIHYKGFLREKIRKDPITINPNASFFEAQNLIQEKGLRHLPVVDENNRLLGIVTESDIRKAGPSDVEMLGVHEASYLLKNLKVSAFMTPKQKLVTITPDALIEEVIQLMHDYKLRCLPVVEGEKLYGIFTETDAMDHFVDIFGLKPGKLDHNAAQTGDDLRDFVNGKLFPYLHGFKQKASGPNTIEYKIGEIFGEIKNKIHSGYNLREIIDHIDELRFRSQTEKHELSHLYEAKIRNMGNAGRNGGEHYTPRPLIRAIVRVVNPKIGERVYDGAVGSAGFLCEAFDYLKSQAKLTTADLKTLQERTFYGKEKKSLAYVRLRS